MSARRKLQPWWSYLLLAFFSALVIFWQLGRAPLMDPHESSYAVIPLEMLQQGHWLTPYLNGARYLDKPPLFYWLLMLIYHTCGVSEYTARLLPALATAGQIWLVVLIARLLAGSAAGFWSGWVLATSLAIPIYSHNLLLDQLFTFFLTGAFFFIIKFFKYGLSTKDIWGFYCTVGAAGLTKGLVGLFYPGMALLLLILCYRQWDLLPRLRLLPGLLIIMSTVGLWHLLIMFEHPGFASYYFWNEHLARLFDNRYPHDYVTLSVPVFWGLTVLYLFPWGVFAPAVFVYFCRYFRPAPSSQLPLRLLQLWIVVVLGIHTLSAARADTYSLPALPPLAVLIGIWLAAWVKHEMPRQAERWGQVWYWLWPLILATALYLLPYLFGCLDTLAGYYNLAVPSVLALGIALALSLIAAGRWCYQRTQGALLLGLALLPVSLMALRGLERAAYFSSSQAAGRIIKKYYHPQMRLIMDRPCQDEYEYCGGLNFYTRLKVWILHPPGSPRLFFPPPAQERFFVDEATLLRWWQGSRPVWAYLHFATVRRLGLQGHLYWHQGDIVLLTNVRPALSTSQAHYATHPVAVLDSAKGCGYTTY